jgi:diguanylate cyclase (GGDEF)-like protein/PAS domain S-box-containing protein
MRADRIWRARPRDLRGLGFARSGDPRWVFALAGFLAVAISVLRLLDDRPRDAPTVLFVVPIALCAVRFGLKGGLAAASLGFALVVALTGATDDDVTVVAIASRTAAFFLVGAIVGRFADRRDELEGELAPHQNLSLDLIATAGFAGYFLRVNRAWTSTLGWSEEEMLTRPIIDFVHPDDREATRAEGARLGEQRDETVNFQNRYLHRDGGYRWLEWMIRPAPGTETFYAIARDITTRKEAEDSIRLLLEQLAMIQRAIAERSPLDTILDAVVQAASRVIGCTIVGLRMIDESDPSYVTLAASTGVDGDASHALRRAPVTEGIGGRAICEERLVVTNDYGSGEAEIRMLADQGLRAAMAAPVYGHGSVVGSIVVATSTGYRFTDADAETLAFFAEYAGVAIATARAADAVRQALTDPLTGLPNRALFVDRLDHAMVRAERSEDTVSVLFLDVDDFKLVNDSLGHHAGDQLLIEVAKRIRTCMRRSDTAARLGGDEFAILLAQDDAAAEAEHVAGRIVEALAEPFSIEAHELHVHASIGVASGRDGAENLLRDADIAMYGAKATRRGGVCVFEPSMQAAAVHDLELRNELLRAVAKREIAIAYQPIVALADGRIMALEALARWTHPTLGPISPEVFIPLAESAGVIDELGALVLHRACADLAGWRAVSSDQGHLQVTVNVSAHQLGARLLREAEQALGDNGLATSALVLEITETSLLHDPAEALIQLSALRSLGIQVAIDDFGTGYSSLSYLRSFPVDALKIAKPFIDGIADDDGHEWAFARLITDLATTLGIVTVAEGIETAGQHRRLVDLGCAYGQGYLYSRPVAAADVGALLTASAAQRHLPRAA